MQKSNFLQIKKEKRCIFNVSLIFTYCRRPESNRYGYHYPRDFKSRASASSATAARDAHTVFAKSIRALHCLFNLASMGGGGFEPPKQIAADLQSVPFGHSGIHPYGIVFHKADDRTRTDNLLITNQLLCQLSHIGECLTANGWRWIRTTEAICSRFTVCPLWPLGNPSISCQSIHTL